MRTLIRSLKLGFGLDGVGTVVIAFIKMKKWCD